MKRRLLLSVAIIIVSVAANAQCYYMPSNSGSNDSVTYLFTGGSFQSYGCAPIDPTYWISGNGMTCTMNFTTPEDNPTFRVWGMNTDDYATVHVNGIYYPLTATSAAYDAKVVCGISPGPDGVMFSNGQLVGANNNSQGNYSYQDIQIFSNNVSTLTVTGTAGLGWGFAGVSINCPLITGINNISNNIQASVFPNPLVGNGTLTLHKNVSGARLEIFNQFGQLVRSTDNISGKNIKLSRNNLPPGFYFLRLSQQHQVVAVSKLIIAD